jgi:cytochrome c2
VFTIVRRLALILMLAAIVAGGSTARAGDSEKGREAFAACAACHAPDKNGLGPRLAGVVGRTSGSVEGFRYSRAMKNCPWQCHAILRHCRRAKARGRHRLPELTQAAGLMAAMFKIMQSRSNRDLRRR